MKLQINYVCTNPKCREIVPENHLCSSFRGGKTCPYCGEYCKKYSESFNDITITSKLYKSYEW